MLKFTKENRLDLDALVTLEDYLRALAYCNASIIRIDAELDIKADKYPDWAIKARTARKHLNWQRRCVCDQLGVLKQQRKEVAYSERVIRNEILIDEFKKLLPHSEFMELVLAAEEKARVRLAASLETINESF
ncbi:hypothetical protein [Providencia sneebia]|uniref:Uncharacterized protein n=1 Tax=Providencia sneebia DSM 19967 TaxID=1141660 RepID=K8WHR4_9GAMM|nr:hypothetical protein [Providencia sneebia]EKT55780.1 hypothetical protein OO7_12424 [Providencia sneebia DSM 19967]